MAPALLAELGEPYRELSARLEGRYGARDPARVLSRLLGVSAHPDAHTLARTLAAQLAPVALEKQSGRPRAAVVVPASLSGYVVEAGSAADYDRLLVGARDE